METCFRDVRLPTQLGRRGLPHMFLALRLIEGVKVDAIAIASNGGTDFAPTILPKGARPKSIDIRAAFDNNRTMLTSRSRVAWLFSLSSFVVHRVMLPAV